MFKSHEALANQNKMADVRYRITAELYHNEDDRIKFFLYHHAPSSLKSMIEEYFLEDLTQFKRRIQAIWSHQSDDFSVSNRPVNYDRLRKRQGHQRHNRRQKTMIIMAILTKIKITVTMGRTLTTETKITVTFSTTETRITLIVLVTMKIIMIIEGKILTTVIIIAIMLLTQGKHPLD